MIRVTVVVCVLFFGVTDAHAQDDCLAKFISAPKPVIVVGCMDGNFSVLDAASAANGAPKVLFHFEASNGEGGFFMGFGKLRKASK